MCLILLCPGRILVKDRDLGAFYETSVTSQLMRLTVSEAEHHISVPLGSFAYLMRARAVQLTMCEAYTSKVGTRVRCTLFALEMHGAFEVLFRPRHRIGVRSRAWVSGS